MKGMVGMKYRRLDENGDMLPVTAAYTHLEGAEAVGAVVRSRILSFRGEWWEYPNAGIPVELFFGRTTYENKRVFEALLRQRIIESKGVKAIEELIILDDPETRKRSISVTIDTDDGTAKVEVV